LLTVNVLGDPIAQLLAKRSKAPAPVASITR
jgi:hypothetical protein